MTLNDRDSRSFKVTDFGTNRKLIHDFLLVINTNLPAILHRLPSKCQKWLYLSTPFAFNPPPDGGALLGISLQNFQ